LKSKYYLKQKDLTVGSRQTTKHADCVGNSMAIKNSGRVSNSSAIKNSVWISNSRAIKHSNCETASNSSSSQSFLNPLRSENTESVIEKRGQLNGRTYNGIKKATQRKAISVKIKRLVWSRDQGKCQHFNPTTGKTCGSNHLLEFDHIQRHRHGGKDHPNNLRLLCKAHNLWRG
jgi:hypothetical protein